MNAQDPDQSSTIFLLDFSLEEIQILDEMLGSHHPLQVLSQWDLRQKKCTPLRQSPQLIIIKVHDEGKDLEEVEKSIKSISTLSQTPQLMVKNKNEKLHFQSKEKQDIPCLPLPLNQELLLQTVHQLTHQEEVAFT